MQKSDLGYKLKLIRKSKKLTQFELAELAGINEKHISKIETGVYFPTYTTLNKILKALNITIEEAGLNLDNLQIKENPFYIKSLQILNNASNDTEIEIFYNSLEQTRKNIKLLNKK